MKCWNSSFNAQGSRVIIVVVHVGVVKIYKEVWLNLGMKCWNSSFNAQGSRVIIVVVHVGAVKIYVVAVEELRKKEKGGWWGVLKLTPLHSHSQQSS
jgi:predicted oxidoreductase (fatty acid repression mutant protein)